mmetsp:Transcript_18672/g.40126  ORF Transcript_18672/g.40126 Transcript_18672/m.40126 type:complete len:211 (+) Transcript_18672:949-1581(+)
MQPQARMHLPPLQRYRHQLDHQPQARLGRNGAGRQMLVVPWRRCFASLRRCPCHWHPWALRAHSAALCPSLQTPCRTWRWARRTQLRGSLRQLLMLQQQQVQITALPSLQRIQDRATRSWLGQPQMQLQPHRVQPHQPQPPHTTLSWCWWTRQQYQWPLSSVYGQAGPQQQMCPYRAGLLSRSRPSARPPALWRVLLSRSTRGLGLPLRS